MSSENVPSILELARKHRTALIEASGNKDEWVAPIYQRPKQKTQLEDVIFGSFAHQDYRGYIHRYFEKHMR